MRTIVTYLLLASASMLLAGCGEGTEAPDSKPTKEPPNPRAGYFGTEESDKLNPAIAAYNEAAANYERNRDACHARATRMHKAGRPERQAVKCELDDARRMVEGAAGVSEVVDGFDGDYRDECQQQLDEFRAFMDDHVQQWQTVHDDWKRYAQGRSLPQKTLQKHVDAAIEGYFRYAEQELGDLSKPCYIQSDLEEAARQREQAEKTATGEKGKAPKGEGSDGGGTD